MSQFVAACFNLALDPADQEVLRDTLPISLWDLHPDMCRRAEFDYMAIVDFIEIRLPITAAADCCMEKDTDVLKIIFLHLERVYEGDADLQIPESKITEF